MAIGDYRKMRDREIAPYQKVMRALLRFHGSINKTVLAIGISEHAYYRLMSDDQLVVSVARKIMAAYTAMQNQRMAA